MRPLITFEIVLTDTPAWRATSWMVLMLGGCSVAQPRK
jgi:hypothetical protein